METLSRHLCDMVSQMDDDFVNDSPPDERDEAAEWVASKMTAYLLESLEAFKAREGVSVLEKLFATQNKTILENRFDECYTRQLLKRVPKMVARTMRLSQNAPSEDAFTSDEHVPEGGDQKLHLWIVARLRCSFARRG